MRLKAKVDKMTSGSGRTIVPPEEGWGKILSDQGGQGSGEAEAQPQALAPRSLEETVEAAPAAAAHGPTYPQKLISDVNSYLYDVFAQLKQSHSPMPAAQNIANAAQNAPNSQEAAHANLFLQVVGGLEEFSILHNSYKVYKSKPDTAGKEEYKVESRIRFKLTVSQVREYLTALFGEELLKDPSASDFNELPLDEIVTLSNLPVLLPNVPTQFDFVQQLRNNSYKPFKSPYFIVMAMQPESTRLLAARAMFRAFARGEMSPRNMPEKFEQEHDNQMPYPLRTILLYSSMTIPEETLEAEAQRLGLGSTHVAQCTEAYSLALKKLEKDLEPSQPWKK